MLLFTEQLKGGLNDKLLKHQTINYKDSNIHSYNFNIGLIIEVVCLLGLFVLDTAETHLQRLEKERQQTLF